MVVRIEVIDGGCEGTFAAIKKIIVRCENSFGEI
jgi:hypothetical protein